MNEPLLACFRAAKQCAWCHRPTPHGAEPHHLHRKGFGGGSQLDIEENLLPLCMACHDRHHYTNEDPSREDLLGEVAARLGLTAAEVQQRIWDALREKR